MKKLLILTYASQTYYKFVVPFIFFALNSNHDTSIEVIVEDLIDFKQKNKESIKVLNKIYKELFYISQNKLKDTSKNSIRFIQTPHLKAEYLYITDVDILLLENILETHLKHIIKHPFSNIIRPETINNEYPKLTGLHFIQYDKYYPLPDISDIDILNFNDECLLYEIMKRKNIMISPKFSFRPICGIHLSQNRDPLGRMSSLSRSVLEKNITTGWNYLEYKEKFYSIYKNDLFGILIPHLDIEFKMILLTLECAMEEKMRNFHRFCLSYVIEKELFVSEDKIILADCFKKRNKFIENKELNKAEEIMSIATLAFPLNIEVYYRYAHILILNKKYEKAILSLCHCLENNGFDLLKRVNFFKNFMIHLKKAKNFTLIENMLKKYIF